METGGLTEPGRVRGRVRAGAPELAVGGRMSPWATVVGVRHHGKVGGMTPGGMAPGGMSPGGMTPPLVGMMQLGLGTMMGGLHNLNSSGVYRAYRQEWFQEREWLRRVGMSGRVCDDLAVSDLQSRAERSVLCRSIAVSKQ